MSDSPRVSIRFIGIDGLALALRRSLPWTEVLGGAQWGRLVGRAWERFGGRELPYANQDDALRDLMEADEQTTEIELREYVEYYRSCLLDLEHERDEMTPLEYWTAEQDIRRDLERAKADLQKYWP